MILTIARYVSETSAVLHNTPDNGFLVLLGFGICFFFGLIIIDIIKWWKK